MKKLKYIKYRMQGYNKYEAYNIMILKFECTFEEYQKMYDRRIKQINKKEYGNSYKDVTIEDFEEMAGEANVSDKRNSRHKRKANRT